MIRTKTTLVVGAGASEELGLPEGGEMLTRIAQSFDFRRLGSDLQTDDMVVFAQLFAQLEKEVGAPVAKLKAAAQSIRTASRISTSLDSVLEQLGDDPLVQAVGKLAIVHYTLRAEAKSPLAADPRDPGDLPIRGSENWLFQLGRVIVNGVARSKVDTCLDKLTVVYFGYDRAIEHFLPYAMHMAFGMGLGEARELVDAKLKIIRPYGCAGRLEWQAGEGAHADWGEADAAEIFALAEGIHTRAERLNDRTFNNLILGEVAASKRIVFAGFGFDPRDTAMLFDRNADVAPDLLVGLTNIEDQTRLAISRLLRRHTGVKDEAALRVQDLRAWQLLRDFALFLES
ncbi:hypothetical protein [Aurantiacibacter spongiae]|uniref:SIR2-like domain-containing protein n=1 Tax=Aurantiacibacter spongiae TaxID=2488860 RepID=A0A3N5CTL4_9SPHN|nr:hypothetical protein [Aurantiacibacter spongiae]RPF72534.1 hypothetical protein EG799_13530 [Aurantiacibacter spongiae]